MNKENPSKPEVKESQVGKSQVKEIQEENSQKKNSQAKTPDKPAKQAETKQTEAKQAKTKHTPQNEEHDRLLVALRTIDFDDDGYIIKSDIVTKLQDCGLSPLDPRLQATYEELAKYGDMQKIEIIELDEAIKSNSTLLVRAFSGELVLPQFSDFAEKVQEATEVVRGNKGGEVADYIPQLGKVNPEKLAVAICTIDGQSFVYGDSEDEFCLQSTCKPLLYSLALEDFGEEVVHEHIGREPSGLSFNELSLNSKGLPHNPMINAGAIMSSSLIKPKLSIADRFEYFMTQIQHMAGAYAIGFDNSVYLSEKETGDRNFALGYFMREHEAFPRNTDLLKTLEFYFQCCSIQTNVAGLASIAATLANAGIQPQTNQKIFTPDSVKNCLSLMLTCGMYDYSGEWAFLIGLPAKSGVSGAVWAVVPGVMGICVWSPRLNKQGNSVRGIEFYQELISNFNFHNFDGIIKSSTSDKEDPRLIKLESSLQDTLALLSAAANGDMDEIVRLAAKGTDLNSADYDGRTALHLAASEGEIEVLEYLIAKHVKLNSVDRWEGTPLDDAHREGHTDAARLLEQHLNANIT